MPANSDVDAAAHARRLSWIALGAAVLAFVVITVSSAFGRPSPWTSWLLGVLLISNPAVYLLSVRRHRFRAARLYYRLAAVASLVALAGIVVRLWHR
jgi:hypothetical protein